MRVTNWEDEIQKKLQGQDDHKQDVLLMSIKPKYAELIFNGKKIFEYRKKVPVDLQNIKYIVFYESSPVQRMTGHAEIKAIHGWSTSELWEETRHGSGLKLEEYQSYFNIFDPTKKQYNRVYAYELKNVVKYQYPKRLDYLTYFKQPPQDFAYLVKFDNDFKVLKRNFVFRNTLDLILGDHDTKITDFYIA